MYDNQYLRIINAKPIPRVTHYTWLYMHGVAVSTRLATKDAMTRTEIKNYIYHHTKVKFVCHYYCTIIHKLCIVLLLMKR